MVKAAYKALAQRYHPDRFAGDAAYAKAKMEALNEAYRVLSNAHRRQAYDRELMGELTDSDSRFAEWISAFINDKRQGD